MGAINKVDTGFDMFGNEIKVGQKVLYVRSSPGGVGIGEVLSITEYCAIRGKNLYEFSGYEYFKLLPVNKKYEFEICTQHGRKTYKTSGEVIGYADETSLAQTYCICQSKTNFFPTFHLVRDKDGDLAVFEKYTPIRTKSLDELEENDMWGMEDNNYCGIEPIDSRLYPELKWEDEPILLKKKDWVPISELPTQDGTYLVYFIYGGHHCVNAYVFKNGKWGNISSQYNHYHDDIEYVKDDKDRKYIAWYKKTTI